ncbi:Uncharacterised protein [Mycobacteroides abscessus subsp. abscessus]|nr:Uncharacterised protein [Mycobacteroides abscessus subsp. abscessus]
MVRVAAEGSDVVAHPRQRGYLVTQRQVVVETLTQRAELKTAQRTKAVRHIDDDDVAIGGQPCPAVQLQLPGTEYERTARYPHHHRQTGVHIR